MAGGELVRLERRPVGEGLVAIVTLDDPKRRNMMSPAMVDGIVAAFESIEADEEVGAVVVAASSPGFCAGADLGDLASASSTAPAAREKAAGALEAIYEGFLRVARCPLPTVVAVNGPAIGAGMNLALACDLRLVTPKARFECRFGDLGLHPGGGHTYLLSRLVGPERAASMLLFGEVLRGGEIVRGGLASRLVDDDEVLEEAVTTAGRAAGLPRELAVRMKESLRFAERASSHAEAVAHELEAQVWSLFEPFFSERLAALRSRISKRQS